MKKVSYSLDDMKTIAGLLNGISTRGLTLMQARYVTEIAEIIDNRNTGIEEVDESSGNEKPVDGTKEDSEKSEEK